MLLEKKVLEPSLFKQYQTILKTKSPSETILHCLSPRYILFYQIIKDYRGAIVKCKESYEDSEVAKDNVTKQAY